MLFYSSFHRFFLMDAGLWIIVGGIVGVTVLLTVALWMWSRKIKKGKLPAGKDGNVSL